MHTQKVRDKCQLHGLLSLPSPAPWRSLGLWVPGSWTPTQVRKGPVSALGRAWGMPAGGGWSVVRARPRREVGAAQDDLGPWALSGPPSAVQGEREGCLRTKGLFLGTEAFPSSAWVAPFPTATVPPAALGEARAVSLPGRHQRGNFRVWVT